MVRRHRWDPVCPPPRGLVLPVRRDPAGRLGPTRGEAAGPRWRRTSRGWFVPAGVDGSVPEQRIVEQSVRLPPGGAVTGWAACRLHRAAFFDGLAADGRTPVPVPLALGRGNIRPDAAVTLSWDPLDPDEVVMIQGVPCTRVSRAVFDEMRREGDLRAAVCAMDMAAAADLVWVRRMRQYVAGHPGWRRVGLVRAALGLADEDSRSPGETRMRLLWRLDAGFPRPLVNQHVWDLDGRLLGIADLLDPVAGLVGEYDGADHRDAVRHSKDVDREARFRDVGLELFRVTGPDLRHPGRVVGRMQRARDRAAFLPEAERAWTMVPPPGWEAATSLDDVLDERDARAELYALWERQGQVAL